MVQTRSKYRSLQDNPAAIESEKSNQLSSLTTQLSKRKRKRKDDKDYEDRATIAGDTAAATSSSAQPASASRDIQSKSISSTPTSLDALNKSNIVEKCMNRSLRRSSSHLSNLSIVLSMEAADHTSDENVNEDKQLGSSLVLFDSSDSEEENFDTNLHLQQQTLIEALNNEANDQDILPLDNINAGAISSSAAVHQSLDSWPIEKNDLHWTKTNKGSDCLIMGSFSYIYMSESQKKNVLNLRCQRRDTKCGAVIHLDLHTRLFIDTNNVNHNHPPDRFAMKQKMLTQKINEKIAVEPTAVLKVVERVYAEANLTDEEQLNLRLPKATANTFYKKRARRYPAHPKNQDFAIPIFYSQNNRGEDFIIYDGNKERLEGRLLMFSTPKLLSALFNSDVILCDGTFKTRPLLFQQVYVLMGRFHGESIPLVWCLTSCRTQPVYDTILKKLQKIAKRMQMEWKVQKCMMDFERAVTNSFNEAFPNVDVKCCWYHFVQSLWRKIQKLGLISFYETDPVVNSWFKQFMALPLISKELITDGVQLLKDTMPSNDKKYHKFIRYFEQEYMNRTSFDLWHHGNNDMKTNNSLEGYNFRLLSRFGLHPSIWEFLHFLKDEEALVSHRITHLGGGSGLTASTMVYSGMQSKRVAITKQKHLLHLENLFNSKSIGLKEYLKSASSMVGKAVGENTTNLNQAYEHEQLVENENENEHY